MVRPSRTSWRRVLGLMATSRSSARSAAPRHPRKERTGPARCAPRWTPGRAQRERVRGPAPAVPQGHVALRALRPGRRGVPCGNGSYVPSYRTTHRAALPYMSASFAAVSRSLRCPDPRARIQLLERHEHDGTVLQRQSARNRDPSSSRSAEAPGRGALSEAARREAARGTRSCVVVDGAKCHRGWVECARGGRFVDPGGRGFALTARSLDRILRPPLIVPSGPYGIVPKEGAVTRRRLTPPRVPVCLEPDRSV
jgi:hypothetical protein